MRINTLVTSIFTLLTICWATNSKAQTEDSCFAKAPAIVGVGQQFAYTVVCTAKGEVISTDFGKFDYVSGPNIGASTSVSINNGSVHQSTTYNYTYYLSAPKEGNFTIPGVTFSLDGRICKTNVVHIKVDKNAPSPIQEDRQADNWFQFEWPDMQMPDMSPFGMEWPFQQRTTPQTPNNRQPNKKDKSNNDIKIGKEDLFLKASTTTLEAYQGEAVVVTHRLYVREDLAGYSIDRASFGSTEDLWLEPLELNRQEKTTETVNGKTYTVFTVKQTAAYPTRTGKVVIPKLNLTLSIRVPYTSRDPFWGMFQTYKSQSVQVTSNNLSIKVKNLPSNHASDRTEVVGNFTINSNISKSEVCANEPFYFTITLSGTGNLHRVNADDIQIEFPADCDVTLPKVISHISAKGDIVTGTKTFRYTIIPRVEGSYRIPSATLRYYDYESGNYKTITTQDLPLEVKAPRSFEQPDDTPGSKPKSNVRTYKI